MQKIEDELLNTTREEKSKDVEKNDLSNFID